MNVKRTPVAFLVLALASCASPPQQLMPAPPPASSAKHAQAAVSMSETAPADRPVAEKAYALKAAGPVVLINATATGTAPGSVAGNAIDSNTGTKWEMDRFARNPSLTVVLNHPTALPLLTLTMNSDAFPVGYPFDVQLSRDGGTFTTVLANLTKTTAGSVTLNIPSGPNAEAKFVRIRFNNRTANFGRTLLGIVELTATADLPAPPPGTEVGNINGTFPFQTLFPGFVQYRPDTGRLRYEAVGLGTDPAQIALNNLAAEALAENPTHRFRGIGKMFRANPDGTNGAELGTADVIMTQPVDELGVIVETDPVTGNEVEIIWPAVTDGVTGANAIVRVQLDNAPTDLDQTLVNVEFTIEKIADNGTPAGLVVASWSGATPNVQVNSTAAGTIPDPIRGGVTGQFIFRNAVGSVPQYRPARGRLRFEAFGLANDPASISLTNLAGEALAASPAHTYRGRGELFRSGANNANGASLGAADVIMVQPVDEPGVIVEGDAATGNEVEIIWPSVEAGVPSDAIVRIQVNNAPAGLDFTNINAEFLIEKIDANGRVVASWNGRLVNVQVPAARN